MATYKVSCQYQVWEDRTVTVKANSPEEAAEKAVSVLQDEIGAENIIVGKVK